MVQVVLGWFSFISGCSIGYFWFFMLCNFMEVALGLSMCCFSKICSRMLNFVEARLFDLVFGLF